MWNSWIQILRLCWAIFPSAIVVTTLLVVLFGDQGLIARSHYKQVLYETRLDNVDLREENSRLALQLRRLKNGKHQLELRVADQLLQAEEGVTIYRFVDENER